jgi:hypothetical protein
MEVLTTLVDHFTTSITELMGMERPFPRTDLPKRRFLLYLPVTARDWRSDYSFPMGEAPT